MNFTETKNYCNILGEALGKFARCFDANYEAPEFRQLQNCYRSICFLDPLEVKQEVLENSTFENVVTVAELYKEQCQHIMNHKRNDIDAEDFEVLFAKLHTEEQKKQYFDLLLLMNERYYDAIEELQAMFITMESKEPKIKHIEIPEDLKTNAALEIFELSVAKGLLQKDGERYRWQHTNSLYGYYVDKVSDKLEVRPANNRVPWKLFSAIIVNHPDMIGTAKQAVNDYTNKGFAPPEGDDIVNDILKAI